MKVRSVLTIWTIIDSHWCNIQRCYSDDCQSLPLFNGFLSDYLWSLGFDIPESITYCLAENKSYCIKFRQFGSKIHLYVRPNIK